MRRAGYSSEIAGADDRSEDTDGFAYLAGAAVVVVCVGLGEAGEVIARQSHCQRQVTHTWHTAYSRISQVYAYQY